MQHVGRFDHRSADGPSLDLAAADRPGADHRALYAWQAEALDAWVRCRRRGVVEAVTGAGKTDVAIAAALDARRRGRFVLVVVPTRVLVEQWSARLREALPGERIGRLGDGGSDMPASCDVLVATRHSAASHRPRPPEAGGLLVADECHAFGGKVLRRALLDAYDERLGLTATLERADDGVDEVLVPFFGGVCYRYDFPAAIADGVCASPRVALVGVRLASDEYEEYAAVEAQLVSARSHLRRVKGMPLEPFGDFLAATHHLADRDAGPDGRAAREYLDAFGARRRIVARARGKHELLGRFAPALRTAGGALLFTETVRAANHAVNHLDPMVAIDVVTGSTPRRARQDILDRLRHGRLQVVAAPRVLDEGVDVPDADLGIVVSASRTRRQMIQRMGRVLRRKPPGVAARFVIMFVRDTLEDPRQRFERDGFLETVEQLSPDTPIFDAEEVDRLLAFLGEPGPLEVPAPRCVAPGTAWGQLTPAAEGEEPYLPMGVSTLPDVGTPRVERHKLSTGEQPLQLASVDHGWAMRCTGCGATSAVAKFRWQALEQTVGCRCA